MKYKNHILKMQEFKGFYDNWCSMLGYYNTNEQAYEATERLYKENFGKRRDKNLESFKVTVSKYFNKPQVKPKKKKVAKNKKNQ